MSGIVDILKGLSTNGGVKGTVGGSVDVNVNIANGEVIALILAFPFVFWVLAKAMKVI